MVHLTLDVQRCTLFIEVTMMVLRQHACGRFLSLDFPAAGSTVDVRFCNGRQETLKVDRLDRDELPGRLVFLHDGEEIFPVRVLRIRSCSCGVS